MLRRTEVALALGESGVVDASCTAERRRADARNAVARTHADVLELRCSAPPDLTARRMRRRLAAGGDPSDATREIAAQMALAEDPWPTAAIVDTSSGPAESLVKALSVVSRSARAS